jgi:hypothetical protein
MDRARAGLPCPALARLARPALTGRRVLRGTWGNRQAAVSMAHVLELLSSLPIVFIDISYLTDAIGLPGRQAAPTSPVHGGCRLARYRMAGQTSANFTLGRLVPVNGAHML